MTSLPSPAAVLFVSDVPRVTRFYQSVAAMTLLHADADHAVLECMGFQLIVHAMRGAPEGDVPADGGPALREDSYTKLCYPVQNLATARGMAATLGGSVQPPEREWSARGFRACDGADPEGNVFQVREPAD